MPPLGNRQILTAIVHMALAALVPTSSARADQFTLASGSTIEGTLLNPNESPRNTYILRTPAGIVLSLATKDVKSVQAAPPAVGEYERLAPTYPNTADDQWRLAEWCRQHQLTAQREVHLRRILELDMNHGLARRTLGYAWIDGEWITPTEARQRDGLKLYRGRWRTQQEIALLEQQRRDEEVARSWRERLHRWREEGNWEQLANVRDPTAVGPLSQLLTRERLREAKSLYIDDLAAIGSPAAMEAIVAVSLNDPDTEIFYQCAEIIERLRPHAARQKYIDALQDENNVRINRAAHMLARFDEKSAIVPLIDVLVTRHKVVIAPRGRGESMTTSFSSDGSTALRVNETPQVIFTVARNAEVHDALVRLAGGESFGYDQAAWRTWHHVRQSEVGSVTFK